MENQTIQIPLVVGQQFKITDNSTYNFKHVFTVESIRGPVGNRMFSCHVSNLKGERLQFTSHCWPEVALRIYAKAGQLKAKRVEVACTEN